MDKPDAIYSDKNATPTQGPRSMNEMNQNLPIPDARDTAFERELTQAFARVDAPATLQKRLLLAAEAEARQKRREKRVLWFKPRTSRSSVLVMPRGQALVGGAIAAVLVLGTIGSVEAIHLQNVRRQEEATRQFAQAEQIRTRALEHAREQLERAGVSLGE